VITALLALGVPSEDISLAAREESEEDLPERQDLGETAFSDLATHSAWERLGWQGGARPPYRDKVAPRIEMAFVAAGPLAIAIGGAQLGACSGGLVGSMGNFGFPLSLAREWYDRLVEGRAWLCVRTHSPEVAGKARGVFEGFQPDLPAESTRHW